MTINKAKINCLLIYPLFICLGIFLLPQLVKATVITEENLVKLTNQQRSLVGAKFLTTNELLAKAAYDKAQAIFSAQTFQHNFGDRKFSAWIKDAEYNYTFVGENLAMDFITTEGVIDAWLNSPTHKDNLLNTYFTEVGIAVVKGEWQGRNTTLIVQIFGSPFTNAADTNNSIASLTAQQLAGMRVERVKSDISNALPTIQVYPTIALARSNSVNSNINIKPIKLATSWNSSAEQYLTNIISTDYLLPPISQANSLAINITLANTNIINLIKNFSQNIHTAKLWHHFSKEHLADSYLIYSYLLWVAIVFVYYYYRYYYKSISKNKKQQ